MKETRNSLPKKNDPWDARFAWFWYNDHEIFRASDRDLERMAAEYGSSGISHVITFSCTHFRWSFRRHWDIIRDTLARVVSACHKHGIYVIEHHSSHLTHNPLNAEDEAYMQRILKARGSSISSWPHLRDDLNSDPEVNGVRLSSFRQIDGRTGNWARSSYRGWCMCFNNPDYRRAYFNYLETLYPTGIDGIMTDDVQWFGAGHACACFHCRRLFLEETGHELPPPGKEWEKWHGSWDEPSFMSWLRFRFNSTRNFHRAVKSHYEGLGLRPLRPNYICNALSEHRNMTATILDTLPDLDWVFQECVFSAVIRYSWPAWAVEAAHRFAVGRWRGIPPMAMFYPDRSDALKFTWALAMSWGVLFTCTPEGHSMGGEEKKLREFEKKHAGLLRSRRRIARIGFYDSRPNRENRCYYGRPEARCVHALKSWMQACYRENVLFDLFQPEEPVRLKEYEVVVLNEVALLSEAEWEAFRSFVLEGGTLIWTGDTGTRDEKGALRPAGFPGEMWGIEGMEPLADGEGEVRHSVGKGLLVRVAGDFGLKPFEQLVVADRWKTGGARVPFRGLSDEEREARKKFTGVLEGFLCDGPDMSVSGMPVDATAAAFKSSDCMSLAIHLVNSSGTLEPASRDGAAHEDIIPLPARAEDDIIIRVRKPSDFKGRVAVTALYHDPERESSGELALEDEGEHVSVRVPAGLFGFYGLVEVKFK